MRYTKHPIFMTINCPSRVVFIHGLFGSKQDFSWYKNNLHSAAKGFSYNLPNHGKRGGEEPFSLPYLLSDLEAQLQTASIERALFIGHSLGGQLALHYATSHPEHVAGICLLDIYPKWTLALQQFQTELLTLLQDLQTSGNQRVTAAGWQSENGRYLHKYLVQRGGVLSPLTCQTLADFIKNEMPLLNKPPYFSQPLTLLQGGNSSFTRGLQTADLKHDYPQIRVEQIAGASHLLHLTHRYTVGQQIQDFIVDYSK